MIEHSVQSFETWLGIGSKDLRLDLLLVLKDLRLDLDLEKRTSEHVWAQEEGREY